MNLVKDSATAGEVCERGAGAANGPVLLPLYRTMYTIRRVEERLGQMFADGEIPGFIHLSIGQEAVPVGVCAALEHGDTVASTHRGHGHAIAKGLRLDRFFLEIFGKEGGYCRGRGGSMHIADVSVGMLGANGIVGAGLPIALGSALAHKTRGTGGVAVAFFGDGALAQGVVHETLNLASLWKLPLLLVCESNGWCEFMPASQLFTAEVTALAQAFGVPGRTIDGNDVLEVEREARAALAQMRAGSGPALLECRTTRAHGHFEGDPQRYREAGHAEHSRRDDPLPRLERRLLAWSVDPGELAAIRDGVDQEVAQAIALAKRGNEPTLHSALNDVYTNVRGDTHG